ncbi:DUF2510 domain-containing protein [Actinomadura macrotermitis]|uniref:DUF2510 domain-containing protein n=1 Tax=Actinomadura macrotermitis TaxID=2585200 RepID=A0A7K0BRY8_9ACTN|nr:DUF2510 domain-containing protein [Actinomadura macrotermitis]MQY03965.1 hypothetical protein [Actinomadura macrotermitis]
MTQPGWYADPYGSGSMRWWDGQNWTQHLNPQPAARPGAPERQPPQQQPPQHYPQQYPPQQQPAWGAPQALPPLTVNVRGLRLHADAQVMAYGNGTLAWDHVEWVAYWAASMPGGHGQQPGTSWVFQIGRHPFHGGPRLEVVLDSADLTGQGGDAEQVWLRLVELCRRQAEQRLAAELAGRVRAGESIDIAQGLTVHPGGVRGNRVSLSWSAIADAVIENGRVWIRQSSGGSPVLFVPQQNPNAVLIPALLAALKQHHR